MSSPCSPAGDDGQVHLPRVCFTDLPQSMNEDSQTWRALFLNFLFLYLRAVAAAVLFLPASAIKTFLLEKL